MAQVLVRRDELLVRLSVWERFSAFRPYDVRIPRTSVTSARGDCHALDRGAGTTRAPDPVAALDHATGWARRPRLRVRGRVLAEGRGS